MSEQLHVHPSLEHEIRSYTIRDLERLEPIICPRCGGAGRHPARIHPTAPGEGMDVEYEPCDVCNGERRIWRLRKEAS